jgi:hypothetical protein
MAMSPTLLSRVLCSGSQQGGMENGARRTTGQATVHSSNSPPGIDLGHLKDKMVCYKSI